MKWIEKCVGIKIISKNFLSLEFWDCVSICHHNTRHFRKKFVRRHWRISILKFKMSLAGRTTMAVRRLTTSAIRQDLGHVPPPGHVRLSILFCLSNMSKYWCYNNFFRPFPSALKTDTNLPYPSFCFSEVDSLLHSLLSGINCLRNKLHKVRIKINSIY